MGKSTEELERENACYSAALDKISSGIIIVNRDGKIFEYNDIAAKLESMDKASVIGKSPLEVYTPKETPPGGTGSHLLNVQRSRRSVLSDYVKYANQNDKIVEVYQSYFPVIKDGEVIGSFSVLDEVSLLEKLMRQILASRHSPEGRPSDEFGFGDIVGRDPRFLRTAEEAGNAAQTDANVLLVGETGTGKELFVRAIHNASRHGKPFVPVNCASIPDTLMESILFGAVRGSYTGAQNTEGLFEAAKDGTLFLDELNAMNINCQSKLLRAIQERRIRRVGGTREIPVSCRIIAAINVDPMTCIEDGTLRRDLFYRLSAACISIPPLRERREDIPLLTEHFIARFNAKYHKRVEALSDEMMETFRANNWKGNVRELENIIEGMFIMADDETVLGAADLSYFHRRALSAGERQPEGLGLKDYLWRCEREIIAEALRSSATRREAAEKLGITAQSLNYKLRKFGL